MKKNKKTNYTNEISFWEKNMTKSSITSKKKFIKTYIGGILLQGCEM